MYTHPLSPRQDSPTSKRASLGPSTVATLALLAGVLMAACSGPAPTPTPPGLVATVISTDLGVGTNRLAFAIVDREAGETVREPEAQVSLYAPGDDPDGPPTEMAIARFRPWPLGGLGVYTTQVGFDREGDWGLRASVTGMSVQATVQVKGQSSTPTIGALAPTSVNKTSKDVENLAQLTTSPTPDPDLYDMTVRQALASGMPLVLVFATPAFCQTATCGPQVEVLSEVKERHAGSANFIHVEVFDSPHKIEGDLSKAHPVPSVAEWGLPTEPWTFIVDRDGRVASKFEAFTTGEELEEALMAVLQ